MKDDTLLTNLQIFKPQDELNKINENWIKSIENE